MIKKVNSVNECIECGSKNIKISKKKNEVFCNDCGAIFEPLQDKEEAQMEKARGFGFTKHIFLKGLFRKSRKKK